MKAAAQFYLFYLLEIFLVCGISIRIDFIFENGYNKYATSFLWESSLKWQITHKIE